MKPTAAAVGEVALRNRGRNVGEQLRDLRTRIGDRKHANQRDQACKEGVLDQVLAGVLIDETIEQILHGSLHSDVCGGTVATAGHRSAPPRIAVRESTRSRS